MRALKSVNTIDIKEPFTALQTQGMVCHQTFKNKSNQWLFPNEVLKENNQYVHINTNEKVIAGRTEKMSKSKKNVIDPQEIIDNYGADTARFFMLSDSPPDRDMEWSDSGIDGSWRFLNKLWRFVENINFNHDTTMLPKDLSDNNLAILRVLNLTIKDVTEAIDNFHFNNAIASIRSLFNSLLSYKISNINDEIVILHSTKNFLILINPMVPHLAEELWANLKSKKMICNETWPSVNNDFLLETNVEIPIQINGKMRALINVPIDTDKETLEKLALMEQNVKKFLNATPKKVIIIPNRIINFVL
jgi:leucyl-tRNA synthetase